MYKNIISGLTYLITQNCPQIKFIALYRDSYLKEKAERNIPLPAVLVEIHPFYGYQLPNSIVDVPDFKFTLHLMQDIPIPVEKGEKLLLNVLNQLKLVDFLRSSIDRKFFPDIHLTFDNWCNFGSFKFNGLQEIVEIYDLYIHKLEFEVQMNLGPAYPQYEITIESFDIPISVSGTTN